MSEAPYDLSLVGKSGKPGTGSWDSFKALLYAVAVGAGQEDPSKELEFTTENSPGIEQKVLPSFINVAGASGGLPDGLVIDLKRLLHAEQGFTLHKPIPVEGTATGTQTITGIYDKGSGALISTSTEIVDAKGEALATIRGGLFMRGLGGWGGERGPEESWQVPEGKPDIEVKFQPPISQALVYRLTGDRNPLHSSPEFAKAAGFDRPILHGMCTYGYTARLLLHAVSDGDPAKFSGMFGRFSKTVLPGEPLALQVWKGSNGESLFRTVNSETGEIKIDKGRVQHA